MRTFSSLTKTLIFGEKRKTVPANEETENVSNVFSRKGESHKVLSPRGQSCMFLFLFLPSPPPARTKSVRKTSLARRFPVAGDPSCE